MATDIQIVDAAPVEATRVDELGGAVRDEIIEAAALGQLQRAASHLAHHIKNPLAEVGGALTLLRDRLELQPEDSRIVDQMVERLEELGDRIDELARFGRPRAPELGPTSTISLVRGAVAQLPGEASLRVADPVGEDLTVRCDAALTVRALGSLLDNALAFSPTPEEVTITTRRTEGCGEIEIRDSGPGFASTARSQMFAPFSSTRPRRLGLGLAIARHVARTQGGDVVCLDDGPDGTRMALRLQLAAG